MKTNKSIKIKSIHSSLSEAVELSGLDLSYNEREARQTIARLEKDDRVVSVLIADDGRIFFLYSADIPLLHEFQPFFSCLSDSKLVLAYYSHDSKEVVITDGRIDKSGQTRKDIAKTFTKKADLNCPLFISADVI